MASCFPTFKLTPPDLSSRLPQAESGGGDDKLHTLYRRCFFTVFGEFPPERLRPGSLDKLRPLVDELGASPEVVLLSAMYASKISSPERSFTSSFLFRSRVAGDVEIYRGECAKRYGTFDSTSFIARFKLDNSLERAMITTERMVALDLIGMSSNGIKDPVKRLMSDKELSLHPVWAAIDPIYLDTVLRPWFASPENQLVNPPTKAIRKLRGLVRDMRKGLGSNPENARYAFETRDEACRQVWNEIRHRVAHPFCGKSTVTNSVKFWATLKFV